MEFPSSKTEITAGLTVLISFTILLTASGNAQPGMNFYNSDLNLNNNSLLDAQQINPSGENLSINASRVDLENNTLNNISTIENFFDQTKCGSDEAVKTVYPNGSYECNTISSDQSVENLSTTLEAGNIANQSIDFSEGIEIGGDDRSATTNSILSALAIGPEASANNGGEVVIGDGASSTSSSGENVVIGRNASNPDGGYSVAIGDNAGTPGSSATAIGGLSTLDGSATYPTASGRESIALGSGSEASSEASVAIGPESNSPNQYEATFGNLDGQELDVNVTGNLTVHGSNLTFANDATIDNFFDQTKCGSDEAVKTVYPNGSYECNTISSDQSVENLSTTLEAGNIANQTIEFDTGSGITIGDSSTSGGGIYTVNIGKGASTSTGGTAIGNSADGSQRGAALGSNAVSGAYGVAAGAYADGSNYGIALGDSASTSADGAVAIGKNAVSPNPYEATLGSFGSNGLTGDSLRMDLNVTGNTTIHGSGGLDMPNGIVVGDSTTSVVDSDDVAIGKGATTSNSASYSSVAIGGASAGQDGVAIGGGASATDAAGVAIGQGTYSSFQGVAIGPSADTGGSQDVVAIGNSASVTSGDAVAIGYQTQVDGDDGVAVGERSTASGAQSMALAREATASADGAVAIGYNSNSPNQYEATFGNLNGEELDVNVTGNLTVHGNGQESIRMPNGIVIGEGAEVSNITSVTNGVSIGRNSVSNLKGVAMGYGADADTGTTDGHQLAVGAYATATSGNSTSLGAYSKGTSLRSTAIGSGANVVGTDSVGIGSNTDVPYPGSIALGANAHTSDSDRGAVAIGYKSNAPNAYEATFGNLNGEELDVNVTGNATIHGSGGLDMPNGVVIGNQSTTSAGAGATAVGLGSEAGTASSVFGHKAESPGNYGTAVGNHAGFNSSNGHMTVTGYYAGRGQNGSRLAGFGAFAGNQNEGDRLSSLGYAAGYGNKGDEVTAVGHFAGYENTAGKTTLLGSETDAGAEGAVAVGYQANAPNQYEATFGNLNGQELDVNVTGNLTVHDNAAFGGNSLSGLGDGDINASDIYYNTLTAKSPVVSCSQGTSWCEVSEPEKQSHYFVKTNEGFDKDKPRKTAVEVVESDVETVEKFEELRKDNERQEEKIEELNSTVQRLKTVVCEENPEKEVCR